jgi:hypothetical protein
MHAAAQAEVQATTTLRCHVHHAMHLPGNPLRVPCSGSTVLCCCCLLARPRLRVGPLLLWGVALPPPSPCVCRCTLPPLIHPQEALRHLACLHWTPDTVMHGPAPGLLGLCILRRVAL